MKDASNFKPQTKSIHSDDKLANSKDIVPPVNVSTIFRYPNDPEELVPEDLADARSDTEYYSRDGTTVTRRVEEVLKSILGGECVVYGSGLSAYHAALTYYNPKRVFMGDVYHGCVGVTEILKRNYGLEVYPLDDDVIKKNVQSGDIIQVETPINPYGVAFDIEKYAKLAHDNGAYLLVDSTFAPPPLQEPFKHGADIVMHSATKYLGGHSDLLAGVLVTKDTQVKKTLADDRMILGTISGSLESWLLLRSVRTFNMRIRTQTASANQIVKYLNDNKSRLPKLAKIYHSSLQAEDFVGKQMPLGGGPVFSIECVDGPTAKALPSKLALFNHATSLGGVESLIEWRRMSDERVTESLLRVSIGCEDANDLIADLEQALS